MVIGYKDHNKEPDPKHHYNLHHIQSKNRTYLCINKGMYGLPQAGRIAFDQLSLLLSRHNFTAHITTTGLWTHISRPISFILCVDDFGVKYTSQPYALFLINILQSMYPITIDWNASHYLGLTISWNYTSPRHVSISMPSYVPHALLKYLYISYTTSPLHHSPYPFTIHHSHQRIQTPTPIDTSPPLPASSRTYCSRDQELVN